MYIIHACCCALTKQGGDFQLQAMQLLLHLRKQAEDTHDQLIKFPLLILLKMFSCTEEGDHVYLSGKGFVLCAIGKLLSTV